MKKWNNVLEFNISNVDSWFVNVHRTEDDEYLGVDAQAAIVATPVAQSGPSWLSFWWAKYETGKTESSIFVQVMTKTGVELAYHSKLPTNGWVSQNITIPQTGVIRVSFLLSRH